MQRRGKMSAEELQEEIESLILAKPETGEQWADICALEAEYIRLVELEREANGQFGVGA